jgi:diguanylate cyclase
MKYHDLDKEQLIIRIEELERLNRQLLKEIDQTHTFSLSQVDNLGHWYLDLTSGRATFNDKKINALGYKRDELDEFIHYTFFTNKLHPDDYEATMNSMIQAMHSHDVNYEYTYRIQTKDGSWRWFYDLGKVVERDSSGKAVLVAGIVFDVTKQKENEIALKVQNELLLAENMIDELTGLKTRRQIMEELRFHLNNPYSNTSVLCVAMIDIDNFKNINDTHGHLVGDDVLKTVGYLINSTIRGFDVVGRYGGEEFLVIFPNTSLNKSIKALQRLIDIIGKYQFNSIGHVTISAGVVEHNNESLEELIFKADTHLYKAKFLGKNRLHYDLES